MQFFAYIAPQGLGFHQSQEKFSREIIFCMVLIPRVLKNEKSPFIMDYLVLESE